MATQREPWAQDEPPDGLTAPVRTIRGALPTLRHARMVFDMVADLLGEKGLIETAGGGKRRTLFRRDAAEGVVPWPLLSLGIGGRLSPVALLMAPPGTPEEPPPRPGRPPRLRGLGPGELVIHDGSDSVTVTYGADGRWVETSRSADPDTLQGVLRVAARKSARPVELVAEYVAGLDPGRHGPGRVHLPAPVPHVPGVWTWGLYALREALFDGHVPGDARWVAADGFVGTALGWGATREEALAAWRAEVERVRPRPPNQEAPAQRPAVSVERREVRPGLWSAKITGTGPASDVAQPEAVPENTPAVVVPLAPLPAARPPRGTWVRLLGGHGTTCHALLVRDPGGFTLVGDRLAEILDLEDLDAELDALPPPEGPLSVGHPDLPADRPPLTSCVVTYRVVDEHAHFSVTPSIAETHYSPRFQARALDGERLRWMVLRQRQLDERTDG